MGRPGRALESWPRVLRRPAREGRRHFAGGSEPLGGPGGQPAVIVTGTVCRAPPVWNWTNSR
jgi:hypothetical protein